ncbi:MAG: SCO family protein [Burkholderiaceae bacterium]|jgi:protein SCO1/2|nr:SCO family protein [Burkholderiaceae bacterium]
MIAASAALVALTGCDLSRPKFHGLDISGTAYGRDLRLPDAEGHLRQLADFRGKVAAVFFGYTMCPDVCPTTLANWAQVKKLLGADGARLQVLFVSVDPRRDQPIIKQYVSAFDASFIGLVPASDQQLADTARDFNVYYRKVPGPTPTSYTMDHTAASYIYDPQGRLRLATRPGESPQGMADDVRLLLSGQ